MTSTKPQICKTCGQLKEKHYLIYGGKDGRTPILGGMSCPKYIESKEKPKLPLCSKYIKKKDMLYLLKEEWEVIELALSKAKQDGKEQGKREAINERMITVHKSASKELREWFKDEIEKAKEQGKLDQSFLSADKNLGKNEMTAKELVELLTEKLNKTLQLDDDVWQIECKGRNPNLDYAEAFLRGRRCEITDIKDWLKSQIREVD